MPQARRRRRIRVGILGVASITLIAASAGGTMGWMMGGTTESIRQFEKTTKRTVPNTSGRGIIPAADAATIPVTGASSPAIPADAWIPVNNTIQWTTPVAPGQPLSGLSIRNGDQEVNLIAHLAAMSTTGAWIPVASMTIAAGREGIIHPPAGQYSMTLVAAPKGMAFERVASLKPSPATLFRMDPVPPSSTVVEPVRFSVSKGVVQRLPDPMRPVTSVRGRNPMPIREISYSQRRAAPVRTTPREDEAIEARPTMTIEPAEKDPPQDQETDDGTGNASS